MSSLDQAIVIQDDDDDDDQPIVASSMKRAIPDRAQLERERIARRRERDSREVCISETASAKNTQGGLAPGTTQHKATRPLSTVQAQESEQARQARKRSADQEHVLSWTSYTPKRRAETKDTAGWWSAPSTSTSSSKTSQFSESQYTEQRQGTASCQESTANRYKPIQATDRFWRGAIKVGSSSLTKASFNRYASTYNSGTKLEEIFLPATRTQPNGLQRVLLTSYDVEIEWLLALIPRIPVTYIGNPPKGDYRRDRTIPKPGFYPCTGASHWEMGVPNKAHPGALQHSKLALLYYTTHLRVIISTGNLSRVDWSRYENDFPHESLDTPSSQASGDDFRVQLEQVLVSLSLPESHPAYIGLGSFCFKMAAAHIVASWPISRVEGWNEIERAGLGRLGYVVRRLQLHLPQMQLQAQGSSLGTYERRWLEQFYLVAGGWDLDGKLPFARNSQPGPSPLFSKVTGSTSWPPIRIMFPTQKYVQETFVEGPLGAGCFFSKPDDYAKKELWSLFSQPVSERGDILMHAKSLLAQQQDQGWVYLGSANFTRAAWGTIAGNVANPTQSLNNWELGIILPLNSTDIQGSALDAIPYSQPARPYSKQDTPWDVSTGLKLAEGEVYSQPAATGIGVHESTQLVAAVDALKPDYDVHSAADIVNLLREKYYHPSALTPQSAAAGMRVAELKESYPPARECVEELANAKPVEDREVLVLRGKRDGVIKHVFWNPIRGEEVKPIDEEFKELWRSLRVPNVVDMTADLESGRCWQLIVEGLSRTKEVEDQPKVQAQQATRGRRGKAKRGAAPRKFKLQNTHLQGVDLSRDFVKQ